ncbi:hypothetical protein CNMCM5623_008711 [Aspergillus felis]|uniref:ATP-grasp domain-containing protein n=1 Tax=Aspergillus felis TaxID=1287682 RepID=A0A8H6PJQ4_9EURO|nr:hypothetical protein CNMCM5623_008711 [Aspergillus felis]
MPLATLLDITVCMLLISPSRVSSGDHSLHSISLNIARELHFPWLLARTPSAKKVVMFNGRKSAEAAKPILETARDLGIGLIILNRPGRWLLESEYTHLFETFIPMDMSFDDDLPNRIVAAVQDHLPIDGIFTPIRAFEMSVDKSQARALNAAEGTQFMSTASVDELHALLETSIFIPQYPLIVKPSTGWSSESVFKVKSDSELLKAAAGIPSRPANPKILVETYVDGPEVDANFVLCNGELLFFEILDDFPCPANESDAGLEADFFEQANVLPTALPPDELGIIRTTLFQILLDVGFQTGVCHLEARIKKSTMEYAEQDGVLDLRQRSRYANVASSGAPTCFLIEINPALPGFQSLYATRITYGIDYMALHLLTCLEDNARIHAFSHPTRASTGEAKFWCQIVFIANNDRQGAQPLNASDPSLAAEIANALSLLLDEKLNELQAAALLSLLHLREKDKDIIVISECIRSLAAAQAKVDAAALNRCDISGTGGNATAIISVAAMASVVASAKLLIAQHGYLSATYPAPSANPEDIITDIKPNAPSLANVTAKDIPEIYKHSNYSFLPERNFLPRMQHANRIRLGLGIRTIFDLTSTLLHPINASCGLEARVVGVANPVLGPVMVQAIRDMGVRKALVVCGNDSMDIIAPEGPTSCWMLTDPSVEGTSSGIQHFRLQPEDFGLSENPLASILAKGSSDKEAGVLSQLLYNQLPDDDPVLQCVLTHVAALFVTSGVCGTLQEDGIAERGPAGGRWKEGVRLARACIVSGDALKAFEAFAFVTSRLE